MQICAPHKPIAIIEEKADVGHMWNSEKDYPLSGFIDGAVSLLGALLLFQASATAGYTLTAFPLGFGNSFSGTLLELTFGWFYLFIGSFLMLFGIPCVLIHFWTFYRLIYTGDSKVKLFFISTCTHAAVCIIVLWVDDFSEYGFRGFISIGILIGAYFTLKKMDLLQDSPI